jgi:hypothetical protein
MTPELAQARLGKLTASRFADAIAKTKSGWGASRANLCANLVAERLTGMPTATYQSAAMANGVDREPAARLAYAFGAGVVVTESDFVPHPTIEEAGASPDGLVNSDGLVEIKCPQVATHIKTLLGAPIEGAYIIQMQWQMACCTGRAWCDWVSYCPEMPEDMQLHVQRVMRDDRYIASLEKDAVEFLAEVAFSHQALLNRMRPSQPAAVDDGLDIPPSLRREPVNILAAG